MYEKSRLRIPLLFIEKKKKLGPFPEQILRKVQKYEMEITKAKMRENQNYTTTKRKNETI